MSDEFRLRPRKKKKLLSRAVRFKTKKGDGIPWKAEQRLFQAHQEQLFLTFFTYVTLLSNKIAGFTPSTLDGAHLLKIRN